MRAENPFLHPPQDPATIDWLSTREGYDRWSEIYDDEDNPLIALETARLDALLGEVAGRKVLDLGCGTGRHTLRMAAAGAEVTALDFSDGMVGKAAGKPGWERVRFIRHDLLQPLPLPDRSFARVLCCLVLEHLAAAALPGFFAECRRVCDAADGAVIISVMHPAMLLRGKQAHFTDPASGRDVRPESHPNQVSDYVMAAVGAGLRLSHLSEHCVDDQIIERSPRSAKYRGWPMLLLMQLRP